jgi:hypothetical protein
MFTVLCTAPIHETVLAVVGMLKTDIAMTPGVTMVLVADARAEISNVAPLVGATTVNVKVELDASVTADGVRPPTVARVKSLLKPVVAPLPSRELMVHVTVAPSRTSSGFVFPEVHDSVDAPVGRPRTVRVVEMTPPPPTWSVVDIVDAAAAAGIVSGAVAVNVIDPATEALRADVTTPWALAVGDKKSVATPTVVMAPAPSRRLMVHVMGSPVRTMVADEPASVGAHASVDADVGVPIIVKMVAPPAKSAPPTRLPTMLNTPRTDPGAVTVNDMVSRLADATIAVWTRPLGFVVAAA